MLLCTLFTKFFMGSTDLSMICFTERYKDHNSILLFLQNFIVFFHKPKEFCVKLVCFEKALTIFLFWFFITQLSLCQHISQCLKKQKKCDLDFIVARIVIFLRQFMVSYISLNTKKVVHCNIVNIGFIVKKKIECVTPVKKLQ